MERSLFPSIEEEAVADIAYQSVLDSGIKWTGIDYMEGARYIALTQSEAECRMSKLGRVLPHRRGKTGARPGVTGVGPKGKSRGDQE